MNFIDPTIKQLLEEVSPGCTVAMAGIGDIGEDIAAVWKWFGLRDWIPIEQAIDELGNLAVIYSAIKLRQAERMQDE